MKKKETKFPKLVSEMKEGQISQTEIARLIGTSQATISRKLAGKNQWRIGEVETICEFFNKDYYQLFK